jgi:outer membrane immunogenic protein
MSGFGLGDSKMKKILFTAATLAALSAPALAADLPSRAVAPAPAPVMVYVYDWTGFYIGGNGGYGQNRACWGNINVGAVVLGSEGCNTKSGGMVGGQVGYRWQFGGAVVGVEAEYDWANMRATVPSQLAIFNPGVYGGWTDNSKVNGVALFTGQIGYAWNAALLYVKGGAALVNNNSWIANSAGSSVVSASSTKFGGTIGVGFEYGFTPNWSARIEYDYLMMGSANNFYSLPAGAAALTNTISQNINMVTVGVNYKFGGPVVARY